MVGTAVYQVGSASSSQPKNFERVEAGRATHRRSGGERRQQGRDQPMDMEQRHDIEAAVVCANKVKGAPDIVGRGQEIGMGERHDFRPRRRAGGVQHERRFIVAQKSAIWSTAASERAKGEIAGKLMGLKVNN